MKNITVIVVSLLISAMSMTVQAKAFLKDDSLLDKVAPEVYDMDTLLVKINDRVVKAETLSKGQPLVDSAGGVIAIPTGKFIIKLAEGVSATGFSQQHNLRLDWRSDNNLLLLSAPDGSDLLKVLGSIKQNPQVLRAELDLAQDFYQAW